MSAAEKLGALDEATPLEKYEIDLFRVLPQIIAVVKAAERLPEFFHVNGQLHSFVPLLDALDEALS